MWPTEQLEAWNALARGRPAESFMCDPAVWPHRTGWQRLTVAAAACASRWRREADRLIQAEVSKRRKALRDRLTGKGGAAAAYKLLRGVRAQRLLCVANAQGQLVVDPV